MFQERNGKYRQLGYMTVVEGDFQYEVITTLHNPYPMVTQSDGKPAWGEEDAEGVDGHVYLTVVTASLDSEGVPDMTEDRVTMDLSARA